MIWKNISTTQRQKRIGILMVPQVENPTQVEEEAEEERGGNPVRCTYKTLSTYHFNGPHCQLIIPNPEKVDANSVPPSIYGTWSIHFWHLLPVSHLLTMKIINSTVGGYNTSERNKHLGKRERERERDAFAWAFSSQQLQLKLTTI